MAKFNEFLYVNGIKKQDIAVFLGVSKAFVTQLCSGTKGLPAGKLKMILSNDNGWDCSMLQENGVAITQSGHHNIIGDGNSIEESAEVKTMKELLLRMSEQLKMATEQMRQMTAFIETQTKIIESQQKLIK